MNDGAFDRLPIPLVDGSELGGPGETPVALLEADYGLAVSPRQLAAGFAIVAGIAMLVIGARRRHGPGREQH